MTVKEYKALQGTAKKLNKAIPVKKVSTKFRDRMFLERLKFEGLPEPEREVRFHDVRRWRFDFAYIDVKIAIEIEGGVYTGGRHTRGTGFINDCEKYNTATVMGWRVLRFPAHELLGTKPARLIKELYNFKGE